MATDLEAINLALEESRKALGEPVQKSKPGFAHKYVLTPLGNTLDVLDTDLNAVTNLLRPVFTAANPELNEIYDNAPKKFGMPNVVPSDLIEKTLEDHPARNVLAPILGFAADVVASPTTYVAGVGVLTKKGKLLKKIRSLKEETTNKTIELGSSLAAEIGKVYKKPVTPALISRAEKEAGKITETVSLAEQARFGQRALINIGIPFTKTEVPFLKSQLFFRGLDTAGKFLKKDKAYQAFHKLFSTSSGNPAFDGVRAKIFALVRLRKDNVEEFAVQFGKEAEAISKETGMDRATLLKLITDIVENPYRGDISADAVLKTFTTEINDKVIEGVPVEKIIRDLPVVDSMSMAERAKLHNALLRDIKERASGFNVHTARFLTLPEKIRNIFVKEWTAGIGLKFAKEIKQGIAQYADFEKVVNAYHRGIQFKGVKLAAGIDAAVFALVGKDEYLRLIKHEEEYSKLAKLFAIPSGVGTEAAYMRDVARRVLAHVDEGFSTSYTLYQTAPEYLKRVSPRLFKLQQIIDKNPEWKIKGLVEQFNIPLHIARTNPKIFDLAQKYRHWLQSQLQLEQAAGVPISEFIGDISYIPHVPTEEARKMLEELYGERYKFAVRDWNIDHLNTLAREFKRIDVNKVNELFNTGKISGRHRDRIIKHGEAYLDYLIKDGKISSDTANKMFHYLTVSEVNTMASLGTLKILNGRKITRFFEENPAQQILIRGIRGERARTSVDFYEGIRQFGKWHPVNQPLPEGMVFLKNESANPLAASRMTSTVGEERLIFDKGIANQIDAVHRSLNMPAGAHPILNIFDKLQDEFKAWTLSIFPAYHTRNLVGSLWNNYLAGIHTPDPYVKALKIQKGANIKIIHGSGETLTSAQVMGLARKHDILNMGAFWGDIEKFFEADVNEGLRGLYEKTLKKAPKFGTKIGNYVQNNANLALFIRRLEEGYSSAEAAMEVRKFQFDYRNITAFERNVMRRVFPFYSWTRFNIPLQIEAAFTHPQRLLAVSKAQNALETNYDGVPDERLLPDYFVQNFPVRIRYDEKRKQFEYFLLNNWLPAADIDKVFNPVGWAKNQLTPFLKEPLQQIANRDFFTDEEVDTGDDYDTLTIFGKKVVLPARGAHALKNVRLISEIDRLADPNLSAAGKTTKVLTGKLYPLEEKKQRRIRSIEFKKRRSKLKADLKRANRKGNEEEAEKIKQRLRSITKQGRLGG